MRMATSVKKRILPNLGTLAKPVDSDSNYEQQLLKNYAHNKPYAKIGPYVTKLTSAQEKQFRDWVKKNKIDFDPNATITDYDMRGFWLAEVNGKNSETQVNPYDHKLHFTDKYKTPYDRDFSNQSQYALPDAPHWKSDRYLIDKNGNVIFDQKTETEDSGWGKS